MAENAFLSYLNWKKAHTLETIFVEHQMVSDTMRYGGTCDWYGLYDGQPWLLDFKTSGGVYDEHKVQTAAYVKLIQEQGYEVVGSRLIQVGKEANLDYQDHPVTEPRLGMYWEIFLRLLDVYWIERALKAQKEG